MPETRSVVSRLALIAAVLAIALDGAVNRAPAAWEMGTPIVTYWEDVRVPLTEPMAVQAAAGNYNLVWVCADQALPVEQQRQSLTAQLSIAEAHGLRAQLALYQSSDPNYRPSASVTQAALDPLIATFASSPAAYSYFLVDEPNASLFSQWGPVVTHLRQQDPNHLAYINLFPNAASNLQLGTTGDRDTAYNAYLNQYVSTVQPSLISYDNYQFRAGSVDKDWYFQNLAATRAAAKQAGVPFMNIVQASAWGEPSSFRVPNANELGFLVHTTLAYGAQGISYFTYNTDVPMAGGIAPAPDGTPTAVYTALTPLNRDFVAIAAQTKRLHSVGAYHEGMLPPGTEPLPSDSPFRVDPAIATMPYTPDQPVQGVLLGLFGPDDAISDVTAAIVVNLDYTASKSITVVGPSDLALFDPASGTWSPTGNSQAVLNLAPGGGALVRLASVPEPSMAVLMASGLIVLLFFAPWWRSLIPRPRTVPVRNVRRRR